MTKTNRVLLAWGSLVVLGTVLWLSPVLASKAGFAERDITPAIGMEYGNLPPQTD